MTLTQIHERMESLLENLKTNPGSGDFLLRWENELDLLERIREELEEWV